MANNAELIKQCEERAQQWLTPAFDEETRKEVKAMLDAEDKSALVDAFYQNLEFGTGGLRGIMGAGTNRMNKYIVGMATQGFANYILKAFPGEENLSVVVGHDCRNNSRLFAETVAAIFSANGIKAYLFESLRPTPEISFAIRELGAKAGVNVTASHNPKEYNGYKAYWSDGAQVLAPHDTGIIEEVNKVTIDQVKFEANWDKIKIIGGEMDYDYMTAVHSAMIDQDVINRQKDLNIVYSAMHGTGRVIVPLCLRSWGFQNINVVPEQMVVDGNFPTVVSPNPENAEAMTLGMKLGTKLNADLVVATDPDADRLAIVCRDDKGEWMIINGNQTAMMFCYYIIENKKKLGKLKPTDFLVKTIVTTEVIAEIAKKNNVELRDCYTGFKWIAREIAISEGKQQYIGGVIKGGDLDNAIVIYERQVEQAQLDQLADHLKVPHMDANKLGYIQHRPLQWENECTRHKLLDIIGDMALIGKPIKGRIIATRPGHTVNNKFARLMRKEIRKHEIQAPIYVWEF